MNSSEHEHYDTCRLRAISITEVARRLGDKLRREGIRYRTLCPWHDDHSPSLSFDERTGKNYCHCFACGKGGDVIAYTMQHEQWTFQEACQWLSATFGIATLSPRQMMTVPKPKLRPQAVEATPAYNYIPMEMVDELVTAESSLGHCLMQMFRAEAVEWLTEEYRLGCYAFGGLDDYTVFPCIDRQGRACNLKIQHYQSDPALPRFGHSDQTTYWLGKIWMRQRRLPSNAQLRNDCLFGEHLLPRYPASTVALVESPKNALYGALAFQQLTWVATGNKGNLKPSVLKVLQGRDVIVIPDCDALEEWTAAIRDMADLANFTVSDICRRMAPEGQPKFDIADYLQQAIM